MLQRQAMLMCHPVDAHVHQITTVLVDQARREPERAPPASVLVSRCIPSTATSPAVNLPVSLEQTTRVSRLRPGLASQKHKPPEMLYSHPRHRAQYRSHRVRLFAP